MVGLLRLTIMPAHRNHSAMVFLDVPDQVHPRLLVHVGIAAAGDRTVEAHAQLAQVVAFDML
jgi:hypothetical protein